MKKVFLLVLLIILFALLITSNVLAAGEECRSIGGQCRRTCISGEKDIGPFGCSQTGMMGGTTCCLPEDQEVPKKSCGESCVSAAECPSECQACQEQVRGQGKVCRVAGAIEPAPAPAAPTTECIPTAIGCIDISGPSEFVDSILKLAIGLAGGIAMLLIVFGGIQILTSAGNPEKIQAGKEMITSAIAGLLLIIFSVFILRIIGVEILDIF